MQIVIIDGQGGSLGKSLVEAIKKRFEHVQVLAIGTNSLATSAMLRSGADGIATGENPVVVAARNADLIVGPLGIITADALHGEGDHPDDGGGCCSEQGPQDPASHQQVQCKRRRKAGPEPDRDD